MRPAQEFLDLHVGKFARNGVALLHQSAQLLLFAIGFEQFVFSQFSPGNFCGAYLLLPLSFYLVDAFRALLRLRLWLLLRLLLRLLWRLLLGLLLRLLLGLRLCL